MKNVFRLLFFAFAFLGFSKIAEASHNAGGDIQYEYISSTGGTHKYKITMRCIVTTQELHFLDQLLSMPVRPIILQLVPHLLKLVQREVQELLRQRFLIV